jgi:D-amino peptidase
MKVYLSVDIEGIAGITHWDEAEKSHPEYPEHQAQMTRETLAACEGAIAAGATEIWIKDAHDTGRNILQADLPECARLIRDWSWHPLIMLQELDKSFDAVLLVGYHSMAGEEGNPLAHTISGRIMRMRLNGVPTSEFLIAAYAASYVGVPLPFVSGDRQLGEHVRSHIPGVVTVATSKGKGPSSISLSPAAACARIRKGVERALNDNLAKCVLKLPRQFSLEIEYSDPENAYRMSWYPGCKHVGDRTIRLQARDYFDVLRALNFVA